MLVGQIDPVMQENRLASKGVQRRYRARLGALPDGVMVQLPAEQGTARLKWRGRLLAWTPTGYENSRAGDETLEVVVLTPECTVKAIAAGYVPEVHPTATTVDPPAAHRPPGAVDAHA